MKTGKKILLAGAALVALTAHSYAQDMGAAGGLEARVKALEDALSAQQDRATSDRARLSTIEQSYNSAFWTFDNGRPTFASGDGRFTMSVRMRMQSDFAGFSQDSTHGTGFAGPTDLSSGNVMRRAYFGVEGLVYKDFWYEFRLNAGGSDGGNNPTCSFTNPAVTTTTSLTGAPGATATSTSSAASGACAIGSIEPAGEGDPLLNKMVVTYVGIPYWHFSIGVIEPSFMMEGTSSSKDLIWIERPEIENIAADSFGAGDSRRGIEVGYSHTDLLWPGDNVAADVAFTGGKTGSAATHGNGGDENTQVLGRLVDRFWSDGISNLEFGVSGGKALYTGNSAGGGSQALRFRERPEIRVDGTRLIDTGAMAAKTGSMWAVDFQGNLQNFFLEGEYAQFTADRQCGALVAANNARCTSSTAVIDHPTFHGWTIGATWILTGENKVYNASGLAETQAGYSVPVPSRPFSLAGGSWGAWELAARYSDTDLNWMAARTSITNVLGTSQLAGITGGEQRVLALGVNWYLNRNVRLMIDDNIVTVKKGTAAIPNRDGQDLNIVGVRLQFAN